MDDTTANLLSIANEYIDESKVQTGPLRQQLIDLSIAILKTIIQPDHRLPSDVLIQVYLSLSILIVNEDESKKYIAFDDTLEIIQNGLLLSKRRGLTMEFQFAILSIKVLHYKGMNNHAFSVLKQYFDMIERAIQTEIENEYTAQGFKESDENEMILADNMCNRKPIIPVLINYLYLIILLGIELFPAHSICNDRLRSLQEKRFINDYDGNNQYNYIINKTILGLNNSIPETIHLLSYVIGLILYVKNRKVNEAGILFAEFDPQAEGSITKSYPNQQGENSLFNKMMDGTKKEIKSSSNSPPNPNYPYLHICIMYVSVKILHTIIQTDKRHKTRLREYITTLGRFTDSFKRLNLQIDRFTIITQPLELTISWSNFGFTQFSDHQNIDNFYSFIKSIASWVGGYPNESIQEIDYLSNQFDLKQTTLPIPAENPLLPFLFSIKWLQCLTRFNPLEPQLDDISDKMDDLYDIFDADDERNEIYMAHCKLIEGLYYQYIGSWYQSFVSFFDIVDEKHKQFLKQTPKELEKYFTESPLSDIVVLAIINTHIVLGPDHMHSKNYKDFINIFIEVSNNPLIKKLWDLVQFTKESVMNDSVTRGNLLSELFSKTYFPRGNSPQPSLTDVISYYIIVKYRKQGGQQIQVSEKIAQLAYRNAPPVLKLLIGDILAEIYGSRGEVRLAEDQKKKDEIIFDNMKSYFKRYEENRLNDDEECRM